MNLTFKGFLRSYCQELTGLKTDNLRKLCSKAASDSPAAAEALMVFAAIQGKATYLVKLSEGTWLYDTYTMVGSHMTNPDEVIPYLTSANAPQRYAKVWAAYRAKTSAIQNDRRVISLMRSKTLQAMESAGISAYALCKELGLNLGNGYAYLHKGDVTKVSKSTARTIMECAQEHSKGCASLTEFTCG